MSRTANPRSVVPRSAGGSTPSGILGSPLSAEGGYFQRSQLPLACLFFLLPFMAIYEVGTISMPQGRIVASIWLQSLFKYFGISAATVAHFLPPLALMAVLLAWHLARRDPWRLSLRDVLAMYIECSILSLPLLALAAWRLPFALPESDLAKHVIASVGAGIYEEFVFRLILYTLLSIFLVDFLKMGEGRAVLPIVCLSAVGFALYHYPGHGVLVVSTFLFRVLGGIYFGLLFVTRGFGITVGVHACYDLMLLPLSVLHPAAGELFSRQ